MQEYFTTPPAKHREGEEGVGFKIILNSSYISDSFGTRSYDLTNMNRDA
jgi:hypothetical protein